MALNVYVLILLLIRDEHSTLKDKMQWPNHHNYIYSWRMANSRLRSHLKHFHKEEYLLLSKQRGWVVQLASVKSQQSKSAGDLRPWPMFSSDAVTDYLVCFITTNNQVRLTLLEVGSSILLLSIYL
jgi:hypothetical protein